MLFVALVRRAEPAAAHGLPTAGLALPVHGAAAEKVLLSVLNPLLVESVSHLTDSTLDEAENLHLAVEGKQKSDLPEQLPGGV